MLRFALSTLLLVGAAHAPRAHAQQTSPQATPEATQARALFERGLALAEEGRDVEAAEAFEASYARVPRPSTALNWAIVLQRTGRGRDALRALDAFDAEHASASPSDVADAAALRARLRALLATLTLRLDPADAHVEVDGRREPGAGTERLIALDPGPHVVRIEAAGRVPRRLSITVAAGESVSTEVSLVALTPETVAAAAPSREPLDEDRARRPLRRGLAVAGALTVIAVVVGVLVATRGTDAPNGGDTGVVLRPFD